MRLLNALIGLLKSHFTLFFKRFLNSSPSWSSNLKVLSHQHLFGLQTTHKLKFQVARHHQKQFKIVALEEPPKPNETLPRTSKTNETSSNAGPYLTVCIVCKFVSGIELDALPVSAPKKPDHTSDLMSLQDLQLQDLRACLRLFEQSCVCLSNKLDNRRR